MTHIQKMWPKHSLKCSWKGWSHGAGTVPMAGISTRGKSTQTSKPKAAPCHNLIRGQRSAATA